MPLSGKMHMISAIAAFETIALPVAAQDRSELSRISEEWLASPHGDYNSLSFTYWNKDGEVPVACAACHSQPGFIDWLGADGSAFPWCADYAATRSDRYSQ